VKKVRLSTQILYCFGSSISGFGLWWFIFTFLTFKRKFFPALYKVCDWCIYGYHTTILNLNPKFRFWALMAYFYFFYPQKFPVGGYITRSYWFWSPNSVFAVWSLFFTFLAPIYFLHRYKISDRLMIFEFPSAQPRDSADSKLFGLRALNIKLQTILRF
jgi:hypothetical protein